tara:strand:- start:6329 stop:7237 length:909 start_codon:yes stop_codon:yes gene_type:complete
MDYKSKKKRNISVVIPVKGREKKLLRAIKSIRYQEDVIIELLIIDDGSKIPIKEVSEGGAINKVKLIRNGKSMNAAYSRNIGIKKATNSIIGFLDSDDEWEKNHLKSAIKYIDKYNCFYMGSFRKNKIPRKFKKKLLYINPYNFLFEGLGDFRTSTFVINKDIISEFNAFDESLNKHQDWDLALRICSKYAYFVNPEKTVNIDNHDDLRMSNNANIEASMIFFNKHRQLMKSKHKLVFFEEIVKKLLLKEDRFLRKKIFKIIKKNNIKFYKSAKLFIFFLFPSFCNLIFNLRNTFFKFFFKY